MQKKYSIYRLAYCSMLVALAMVLSWLEAQFSAFIPLPGVKLGLTNLVVLVALYRIGEKEAIFLNFVRILLVSITFGNMFSMVYSLAGGILSGTIMVVLKRTNKCNMMIVSLAGGIMHNVGQMIIAAIVLQTKQVLFYLPFLWIAGIIAGAVIGIIGGELVKRLPDFGLQREKSY